ncbi:hypothetical protein ACJ41O_007450 [Fusarium nematophilum]
MLTYSTNDTCRPEGNPSNTGTLGNYPVCVLLATTKAHVKSDMVHGVPSKASVTADNVLAFEAVTTSGQYVAANADQNADLFWALKGGGPSTYAVILSVTIKTFSDVRSTGATGVSILHKWANRFVDNGLYAYVEVLAGHFLRVRPFVAGQSTAELQAILDPFLAELRERVVPFDFTIKEFPTFFDLYLDLFEDG